MSFFKATKSMRGIMLGAAAGAILLLPLIGQSGGAMAMGGMGDPSAAQRANAAAYPEFFAPKSDPDPAPNWVQHCRNPSWLAATDRRCRDR
jgi:hypothetical protein